MMIILCILCAVMMAAGQMILKYCANSHQITSIASFTRLFVDPTIYLALFVYGGAIVLWIYILSKIPLSRAYPYQALAFPLVLFLSNLFFHEPLTVNKCIGAFVIVLGIYIAAK